MVYTAGFNVEVLEGEDHLSLIQLVNVLRGDLICDHTALELGPPGLFSRPLEGSGSWTATPLLLDSCHLVV